MRLNKKPVPAEAEVPLLLSFQLVLMLQKDAQYNLRIIRAWREGYEFTWTKWWWFPWSEIKKFTDSHESKPEVSLPVWLIKFKCSAINRRTTTFKLQFPCPILRMSVIKVSINSIRGVVQINRKLQYLFWSLRTRRSFQGSLSIILRMRVYFEMGIHHESPQPINLTRYFIC